MPEEHHAADEHALLAEVTEPLSGLPAEPPSITPQPDFAIVLRGYDRVAVDAYVRRTSELLTELGTQHSPDAAVRRALERVGEQIAGILQRAHDTAAEITTNSRRESEERLIEARREAESIVAAARARLEELDAETDRVWGERERIVDEIRVLAQQLLRLSESAAPPPEDGPAEPDETELDTAPPPPVAAADPDATAPLPGRPPVFDAEEDAPDPDATTVLPRPEDPTA
jgi:hypothetical protein